MASMGSMVILDFNEVSEMKMTHFPSGSLVGEEAMNPVANRIYFDQNHFVIALLGQKVHSIRWSSLARILRNCC